MAFGVEAAMECVLVWLAVMTTTFHTSQAMCEDGSRRYENGDIIVRGVNTDSFVAGRIEVCIGTEWWAVCHDRWNKDHAKSVCRQIGFTTSLHCRESCFGRSSLLQRGVRGFKCSHSSCEWSTNTDPCREDAGIVCSNGMSIEYPTPLPATDITCPTPPPATPPTTTTCPTTACSTATCPKVTCPTSTTTCPTCPVCPEDTRPPFTTTYPTPTTNGINVPITAGVSQAVGVDNTNGTEENSTDRPAGESDGGIQESCLSRSALGGGLGALCAILAIILVGVVMGWVWSCRRRKGLYAQPQERQRTEGDAFSNPTYNPISSNTSHSGQYSSIGPRRTHASPPPSATYDVIPAERIYHVLEGPLEQEDGEGGGREETGNKEEPERIYDLLEEKAAGEDGLIYEMPILSTTPKVAQPATQQVAEPVEYSTLDDADDDDKSNSNNDQPCPG